MQKANVLQQATSGSMGGIVTSICSVPSYSVPQLCGDSLWWVASHFQGDDIDLVSVPLGILNVAW